VEKDMNRKRQRNSGFSLVELITVIAIMGVLSGLITISAGLLSGRQAKQCRDELLASLENVRVTTLGKKSVVAAIENDGTGYVLKVTSTANGTDYVTKSTTICGNRVKLYSSVSEDGSTRAEITSLSIEFDRSSGALKANGADYVYHIYAVENGKEYGIRFYPETGKIVRE
jgi:prepilin-type N-terminal cleavage/methylation domain-containing protein